MLLLAIAVPMLLCDQASKAWAREALSGGPLPIWNGTLYLNLGFNPGIAFSFFTHGARWVLVALALAATAAIIAVALRADATRGRVAALALIVAGALGNALDRIASGVVTDFVVVRAGGMQWPTFNVADGALVVGIFVFLIAGRARVSVAT